MTKTIMWNEDTQKDFMDKNGALYVPGSEGIKPALKEITRLKRQYDIQTINSADWHDEESEEISESPDYKKTFPRHCIRGTEGAEFIPETRPIDAVTLDWKASDPSYAIEAAQQGRDIVIYKDAFDIFEGNPYTQEVLDAVNPDRAIIYGVASNVCLDFALLGLLRNEIEVYFVDDAMAGLPGKAYGQAGPGELVEQSSLQRHWEDLGAKRISTKDLEALLR